MTSTDIDGEWSDPVYLNSSGFDPSLFHDDDGPQVPGQHAVGSPARPESLRRHRAAGVSRPRSNGWSGERRLIFPGTPIGFTEGPHLYKRGGYYYLLDGGGRHRLGPRRDHGAIAGTSTGPYELHPDIHILSARHRPDVELQRAGHADLVETPDGRRTWCTCAAGRCPIADAARSDARPRSRRWSGATTAGCGPSTATGVPSVGDRSAARCRAASRPQPAGARGLRRPRSCRSIFSGCDRPGPTSCSA